MQRRKPQGPVRTLADSHEADYLVTVHCQTCDARTQMHPYKLLSRHEKLACAALDAPLPGFWCKACRRRVSVVISCTYTHPGGL